MTKDNIHKTSSFIIQFGVLICILERKQPTAVNYVLHKSDTLPFVVVVVRVLHSTPHDKGCTFAIKDVGKRLAALYPPLCDLECSTPKTRGLPLCD